MPRIAEESIRQVLEASDIIEVIGSYIRLQRAGSSYRGLCPFHQEKTPSFHVSPAKQAFHCFGCGAGGGVIQFVRDYEHLDFVGAVRRLADRAGVRLIEESGPQDDRRDLRKRLIALHAQATDWFHGLLLKSPEAESARNYLKSRGVDSAMAKRWKLGYAPDQPNRLAEQCKSWGFDRDEQLASGLFAVSEGSRNLYERFRGRMMIPIPSDYGEVLGFSGRLLEAEAKAAKYINSPETPLFKKGKILFGLHRSKRAIIQSKRAIVCEGQLDLITAFEHGIENVVAPQGTAFTATQARLLSRFASEVVLCFDSDAAGKKAAGRSLPALLATDLDVRIMTLPGGADPDSFIRSQGAEAFLDLVTGARDVLDFLIGEGIPESAAARAAKVREIAGVLRMISNPVHQATQANRAAALFSLAPEMIQKEIRNVRVEMPMDDDRFEEDASAREELQNEAEENFAPPGPTAEILCKLAILSAPAKAYLSSLFQPGWEEIDPSLHVVEELSRAPFHPDDRATFVAYLAGLSRAKQAWLAGLDLDHPPEDPLAVARSTWDGLVVRHQNRRLSGLAARMRHPGLSQEELLAIQKEMLDLRASLKELA